MRTLISILLLSILLMIVILTYTHINKNNHSLSEVKMNIDEDLPTFPKDAVEFENIKKADPETGKVPAGGTWKALKEMEAKEKLSFSTVVSKRNDSEEGWHPVNDFFSTLSITRLVYDPNNTQNFYFCTGEGWYNADGVRGGGIWKSSDGGKTWNHLASTDTSIFYWCQDMAVHPQTSDIYVGTRNGLYRSKDEGASWEQVLGSGNGSDKNTVTDIEITKNGSIFVGIGIFETDGIYFSEYGNPNNPDSGGPGSWTKQTNGIPTSGIWRVEIATAPSADSVAYAAIVASDYLIKGIYKTTNMGALWDTVALPGGDRMFANRQGWYDLILKVDPNNADVVVAGGLNLWKTVDGGQSWIQISEQRRDSARYVHVDQHEVLFQSSDTVYFGNDGGVWRSDNFTKTLPDIYERNASYNVTQFYSGVIHPDAGNYRIMGGTQDNGTNMSAGSNISSFDRVTGADGSFCAFNHENGDIFYTSKQYVRMYRFTNGLNSNPDTITNPYVSNGGVLFINPMEIDPVDPEIIYMGSSTGLWRLLNASSAPAEEWERAARVFGKVSAIGVSEIVPQLVFIGQESGGRAYRLKNADSSEGSNFAQSIVLPGGQGYVSSIATDPSDKDHLVATLSNYGIVSVYESENATTDSTVIWKSVEGDLPDIPVNWAMIHPENSDVCYLATEIGVFYTTDLNGDSTEWILDNTFPYVRTDMLKLRKSDNTIVAATHGRGLFTGIFDDTDPHKIRWTERGPENIGGRTRTIMIDPNDPSKKTIWAGSVSGGLWKTSNIDSVDQALHLSAGKIKEKVLEMHVKTAPNPFSSEGMNITLFSPEKNSVDIKVLDLNGRMIAHVFNGTVALGEKKVLWKPFDNLSEGVYFVVVRTGSETSVHKTMYIK